MKKPHYVICNKRLTFQMNRYEFLLINTRRLMYRKFLTARNWNDSSNYTWTNNRQELPLSFQLFIWNCRNSVFVRPMVVLQMTRVNSIHRLSRLNVTLRSVVKRRLRFHHREICTNRCHAINLYRPIKPPSGETVREKPAKHFSFFFYNFESNLLSFFFYS